MPPLRLMHVPAPDMIHRRQFLRASLQAGLIVGGSRLLDGVDARAASTPTMKLDLNFPKLGMKCDQRRAIELAAEHGFQSVSADTSQVATMTDSELHALDQFRQQKGLLWGTAGFPVDFRRDDATFEAGLAQLQETAPKLQQLGLHRLTTWISPAHAELTYRRNFDLHVARMKRVAAALQPFGLRLGLEYVGTQLGRFNRKHGFIHTAAEVLELIDAVGGDSLGVILDSWHWWTTGESAADLTAVPTARIVSVELNDAPEGLAREQQIDNQRRLPATTGVLPVGDFLRAVAATGFAGPVMAEPFYAPLRELSVEAAAEQVAAALRRAIRNGP